jgi:hypothetical protein
MSKNMHSKTHTPTCNAIKFRKEIIIPITIGTITRNPNHKPQDRKETEIYPLEKSSIVSKYITKLK